MRRYKKHAGFTLIELLMVTVIIGIISVVIARILFNTYRNFNVAQQVSEIDMQGLMMIERMANDVHRVRSPSDVITIGPSQFTFTDVSGGSVNYQLTGGTLLRNSLMLGTGVSGLSFTYYDKAGAVTASTTAVRYVLISLGLNQGGLTSTFTTLAALRGTY